MPCSGGLELKATACVGIGRASRKNVVETLFPGAVNYSLRGFSFPVFLEVFPKPQLLHSPFLKW